jgi:hypothetical protein
MERRPLPTGSPFTDKTLAGFFPTRLVLFWRMPRISPEKRDFCQKSLPVVSLVPRSPTTSRSASRMKSVRRENFGAGVMCHEVALEFMDLYFARIEPIILPCAHC